MSGHFQRLYSWAGCGTSTGPTWHSPLGGAYMTSPATEGRRPIALPLDRIITVGADVEWQF